VYRNAYFAGRETSGLARMAFTKWPALFSTSPAKGRGSVEGDGWM
jgi:hypothetical protein